MDAEGRDVLIACWWEHHRLSNGTREQRKALEQGQPRAVVSAYEALGDQVEAGGEDVIELLADLVEAGPAADRGAIVGAGPLEDLIHAHGAAVLDELEMRSRQRPAFREALSAVWLDESSFDLATYERLGTLTA